MNKIGITIVGATALMAFTDASAEAQSSAQKPAISHTTKAPIFPPDTQAAERPSRPLFTIGGMEVHLWAPVEAHYDANMNRNLAADPFWAE